LLDLFELDEDAWTYKV